MGDVHGRADLLEGVFARIDADQKAHPARQPVEVYLGDYIDRGPDSRTVIDLLIARSRRRDIVLLKGNHETYLLEFVRDPEVLRGWRQFGGLETLMSYGLRPSLNPGNQELAALSAALRQAIPRAHFEFYGGLLPYFSLGDFYFVHAGTNPRVPLAHQDERDLLWIREEFLVHEGYFEKMIVHGHTPVHDPDFRPNRINIDTGAYATGRLTCLMIEHDRLTVL
ncbi:metallophosphoesterase [Rhodovulum sp. PH10]|nr:metallophosphoesterase [Rhodovulum sp. PH10]